MKWSEIKGFMLEIYFSVEKLSLLLFFFIYLFVYRFVRDTLDLLGKEDRRYEFRQNYIAINT